VVKPFAPPIETAAPAAPQSSNKKAAFVHNESGYKALSIGTIPYPLDGGNGWHTTRKGARYLPFLNPDDSFAEYLSTASKLSVTARRCIKSKVNYITGGGLTWTGDDDTDLDKYLGRVNPQRQSFKAVLAKVERNLLEWGNAFIEIVRVGINEEKRVNLHVHSFLECRLKMPEEEWDEPTHVICSPEFRRQSGITSLRAGRYVEIPLYDPEDEEGSWLKEADGTERTMIHLKNEETGSDWYGMPSNLAGVPYQLLEYKSCKFNIRSFDNNWVLGGVVSVEAGMTPDEALDMALELNRVHSGEDAAGRWAILHSQQGVKSSSVHPFDTQKEGSFIELDKHVEKKIVTAADWDAVLAGLHRDGGLGNGGDGYLQAVYEMIRETVIEPEQQFLIEHFVVPAMAIVGQWLGKEKWSTYDYYIRPKAPTSLASKVDANKVVTKNEGRLALGYEVKEGEIWEQPITSDTISAKKEGSQNV
jgi:hypothetical protein